MRNQSSRLCVLEKATNPTGRTRYLFHWSSQDHGEARRRWEARLAAQGNPLLPGDNVYCVKWNDALRAHVDDWALLNSPSHPSDIRKAA